MIIGSNLKIIFKEGSVTVKGAKYDSLSLAPTQNGKLISDVI